MCIYCMIELHFTPWYLDIEWISFYNSVSLQQNEFELIQCSRNCIIEKGAGNEMLLS